MYVSRLCFYEYLSRSVRVTNFHLFVSLSRSFVCLCVWLCLHFGSLCISDLGVLFLSISMGHLSLSFAVLGSSVGIPVSLCVLVSPNLRLSYILVSLSLFLSCLSWSLSFPSVWVSLLLVSLGLFSLITSQPTVSLSLGFSGSPLWVSFFPCFSELLQVSVSGPLEDRASPESYL